MRRIPTAVTSKAARSESPSKTTAGGLGERVTVPIWKKIIITILMDANTQCTMGKQEDIDKKILFCLLIDFSAEKAIIAAHLCGTDICS
jgi:hypothetical protein